ncbi:MAG: IclR family transcriptional regulator [Burkholderiales bacterium]|nr:IclR family transcriptional regulator [Burkholderiales bacterium]
MKSLATALRLLAEFAGADAPLSVVELADRLGMNRSQVSKLLKTFREGDLLVQDAETKRYSVGISAFALGNSFVNGYPLSRDALPAMRKLVDETDHSAVLSVLHGSNVIHLFAVEGRLFVDGRWRVGRWMPFHSSSAGRVLLAFGPSETIEYLLRTRGLPRLTPNTITDSRQFRAAVQKVRKTGTAITHSETHVGTAAISVPLFGPDGEAVAALGLIAPEHLMTRQEEERLTPLLHRTAREISVRLGAHAYPFGS